jgi:ParB family chromosome partitioning protein
MASNKAALGRGLKALLRSDEAKKEQDRDDSDGGEGGEKEQESDLSSSRLYRFEDHKRMVGKVAEIEVAKIRPNPYQPRKDFDEEALDELADSIEQLGIIQPLTVRAMREGGQYEIISGERRLRAARRADLERVPAYVRDADSEQMLEMALVENVQREELNPVEVALGYQRLIDECDLTQSDVAEKVGKNRTTVSNFLRLLKLPPRIQAALRDRTVSVGHARALITVDDADAQYRLLKEAVDEDLSVREMERRVRAWQEERDDGDDDEEAAVAEEDAEPAEPEPKHDRNDLQVDAFADRLRSRLSTQVAIRPKKDGSGTVELEFYSEEDLERLLDLILET